MSSIIMMSLQWPVVLESSNSIMLAIRSLFSLSQSWSPPVFPHKWCTTHQHRPTSTIWLSFWMGLALQAYLILQSLRKRTMVSTTGATCHMSEPRNTSTLHLTFLQQLLNCFAVPLYFRTPPKNYTLQYVEIIQRHHKRTPYASNTFFKEDIAWSCVSEGPVYAMTRWEKFIFM